MRRSVMSAAGGEAQGSLTSGRQAWAWVEMMLLFVGVPLAFGMRWVPIRFLMPTLLLLFILALGFLLLDASFDRRRLWGWRDAKPQWGPMLKRFAVLGPAMLGLVLVLRGLGDAGVLVVHENVQPFALPRRVPWLWVMILCLYPLFSVYPQEVLFRAFFHHRYRGLLLSARARVAVGGLLFGWAHLPFATAEPATWVTLPLTVVGGWLFGWTYEKGRGLSGPWLEHALYGGAVFTVGLGWLFYAGSVSAEPIPVAPIGR